MHFVFKSILWKRFLFFATTDAGVNIGGSYAVCWRIVAVAPVFTSSWLPAANNLIKVFMLSKTCTPVRLTTSTLRVPPLFKLSRWFSTDFLVILAWTRNPIPMGLLQSHLDNIGNIHFSISLSTTYSLTGGVCSDNGRMKLVTSDCSTQVTVA